MLKLITVIIATLLSFNFSYSTTPIYQKCPLTIESTSIKDRFEKKKTEKGRFKKKKNNKEEDKQAILLEYIESAKKERREDEYSNAIELNQNAYELALELSDTSKLIHISNELGTNFRRLGYLDKASSYHYKALHLCEEFSKKHTKDIKKNRVKALNGIGNICLTLQNYSVADSVLRLALKGEKELNSDLGLAINYANIGSIFDKKNILDSAKYYYTLSLEHNIKANSSIGKFLCHIYFGELYEKTKEYDNAIEEYKKASLEMNDEIDDYHGIEPYLALGRVYLVKKEIDSSKTYINKALELATRINCDEHLAEAYELEYNLYKIMKDSDKALESYIKSREYSDKVVNLNSQKQIIIEQKEYEKAKTQKEIALLKANNALNKKSIKLMIVLYVVIFILIITAMAFLFYFIRKRKEKEAMLISIENKRTKFFRNITHEFRTPLTLILGLSEKIRNNPENKSETIEFSKLITKHGNNLLTLINQLLNIAKIKSAIGISEDKRIGDIIPYIRMITDNYMQAAMSKNIDFAYIPKEEHVNMVFVPDYIQKILNNLISNALKFTPEFGKIHISTEIEDGMLKIKIKDNGIGIHSDKLPHIFDYMYQADDSHSEIGSGIGLSLVAQIVKAVDGTISVDSRLKRGTIFIVKLPIITNDVNAKIWENDSLKNDTIVRDANMAYDYKVELPSGIEENDNIESILIVEDNDDVAYYIGSNLKNQFSLHYAKNGAEGLDMANEIMPDLIITDVMMPVMDGYEMSEKIRSSDILNHIPIIMITAKCTEKERIKGINAGADAYLYKPFNSVELNVRVKSILELRKLLRSKFSAIKEDNPNKHLVKEQEFLNKFIDITYSMMNEGAISIEELANQMYMSSKQLNRKITSITGKSCSAYITDIRMAKAKRMLNNETEMTIGEIAMHCGYDDNAYFSRIFKKTFNITPSQYRGK